MSVSASQLVPLVMQLGTYLKAGADYYAQVKTAGSTVGPDGLAVFIEEKMKPWNPKIGAAVLLDEPTRKAAARFLAGVIINLANA